MTNTEIQTVADVPDTFTLITDSQDIVACLDSIGQAPNNGDFGCLFAKVGEGEYEAVYGCACSVPVLTHPVTRLWPD